MQQTTMLAALVTIAGAALAGCAPTDSAPSEGATSDGGSAEFEAEVEEFIEAFPYQDTYNYAMTYTGGDVGRFNTWVLGAEPVLVKAGEDSVVRMNNDTFYKMAFVVLDQGPVVLSSTAAADDRFYSFQLMDDRNANYRNVIRPAGSYTLYRGEMPEQVEGEPIEVPSNLSVVIVRVEVKDKNDPADVTAAEVVFGGITINGPAIDALPAVDVLDRFDDKVTEEAMRRIDEAFASVPFTETVVGPGQEPGVDVPYLNFAAGTRGGWGGPDPAHSAYETIFTDAAGDPLDGATGAYEIMTEPPVVGAFWSITVYDTARGGFLHPNEDDRYHINNTAAVENADGTVTFTFAPSCAAADLNCLEIPAGPFDLVARYYLPDEAIINGSWTIPRPVRRE